MDSATEMFEDFLREKKDSIHKRWFNLIIDGFPSDSHSFLKSEANQFNNPVGHTLRTETEALLQALIDGKSIDEMSSDLDSIVRIRAVQDWTPSEAVSFVFMLKRAIRDELSEKITDVGEELAALEMKTDQLALAAFDNYMRRKEKIFKIGAHAEKMKLSKLLERLNKQRSTSGGDNSPLLGDS